MVMAADFGFPCFLLCSAFLWCGGGGGEGVSFLSEVVDCWSGSV
jgi:hypothetical protein